MRNYAISTTKCQNQHKDNISPSGIHSYPFIDTGTVNKDPVFIAGIDYLQICFIDMHVLCLDGPNSAIYIIKVGSFI